MRTRQALVAVLATSALALTACGSDSDSSDAVVTSDLGVEVTGEVGEKPELSIPDEEPPAELEVEVLAEGDGAEVGATDVVVADYLGQTWEPRSSEESSGQLPAPEESPAPDTEGTEGAEGAESGAGAEDGAAGGASAQDDEAATDDEAPSGDPEPYVFDNSYDRGAAAGFSLDAVIPGWKEGLAGQKVGSRVLLSIPPEQGYGAAEGHDLQNDTLVFVVDLVDTIDASATASGEPVSDLPEGMPSVESNDGAAPTLDLSGAEAPEQSDTTVVITGDGKDLEENIVVNMVQASYPDGADLISSWEENQAPIVLAPQQLTGIPGLAEALQDQTVGTRVVTRIAAADNPAQGGSGGTALVLVIDVIGTF